MRTQNMEYMSVTLDVSRLSGWLNADAPCRVKTRAHAMQARCGPREATGRWEGVEAAVAQAARRVGRDSRVWATGPCGAHGEHVAHARDARGVKAQRLVER